MISARLRRTRATRVGLLALVTLLIAPLSVLANPQPASADAPMLVNLSLGPILEDSRVLVTAPAGVPEESLARVTVSDAFSGMQLVSTSIPIRTDAAVPATIPGDKMTPSMTVIRIQVELVDPALAAYKYDQTHALLYPHTATLVVLSVQTQQVPYSRVTATAKLTTQYGKPLAHRVIQFSRTNPSAPPAGFGPVLTDDNGVATLTYDAPDVGPELFPGFSSPYVLFASYPGGDNPSLGSSAATRNATVSPRTETWDAPSAVTERVGRDLTLPISFGATMPMQAMGDTVQVWRGNTMISSAVVSGSTQPTATVTIPALTGPGTDTVQLRYVSRTTPANIKILPMDVTITWTQSASTVEIEEIDPGVRPGDDIWIFARVTMGDAVAVGTVTFTVAGETYTGTVATGYAFAQVPGLPAGEHTVTAEYHPDTPAFASSTSTQTFTVTPAPVTVSGELSSATVDAGDVVNFDVAVANATDWGSNTRMSTFAMPWAEVPAGTATLLIDGQPVGAAVPLVDGTATLTVPTDVAGTYAVSARFTATGNVWATTDTDAVTLTVRATAVTPTDKPAPTEKPALAVTGADANGALLLSAVLLLLAGAGLIARRRAA